MLGVGWMICMEMTFSLSEGRLRLPLFLDESMSSDCLRLRYLLEDVKQPVGSRTEIKVGAPAREGFASNPTKPAYGWGPDLNL